MKLRVLKGVEEGRTYDLVGDEVTLGRGRDNDVVLSEEGVSRHHCRMVQSGDGWLVEDLGSMNGVHVNGSRIEGSTVLETGDEIRICSQVLTLLPDVDHGEAVAPSSDVPFAEGPPPVIAVPSWGDESEAEGGGEGHEGTKLPWGRIALLAIVLILIAILGFQMLKRPPADTDETGAGVVAENVPGEQTAPPTSALELSDEDLAKLIEEEETTPTTPVANTPDAEAAPAASPDGITGVQASPRVAAPVADDEDNAPTAPASVPGQERMASSLVLVTSDPGEAAIMVDGKAAGSTPSIIRDLAPGRHMIVLNKPGYEPFDRQIHVPDLLPSRPYKLRLKAGAVLIRSEPTGAAVWHGTQLLGSTPALITNWTPGEYSVHLTAPGCEPAKKTISVSGIRGETYDVTLSSVLGTLEVLTDPPGCSILVDGHAKGNTVAEDAEAGGGIGRLTIAGLIAGDHMMAVKHPSGASRSGKIKIARGKTTRQSVKLWVPDTKLVLADGKVIFGHLMEKNEHGDVVIAENPRKLERYLKPQIAELTTLKIEEAAEVLAKLRGDTGNGDAETEAEADDDAPQWGDADAGADGETEAKPDEKKSDPESLPPLKVDVDDLKALFKQHSTTEINKHFQNRRVIISGVPSGSGKDGLGGYVSFGRRVRCFIDRDVYEAQRENLQAAAEAGTPIQVSGISPGMRGAVLILRKSSMVESEGQ